MSFVHLHTHTHYSLLDGLAKVDELINQAKTYGMPALAITDHGNLYGVIEFYQKAKRAGIKPIIGVEAYLAAGSIHEKNPAIDDKQRYHLILLAKNNTGYRNLIQLVTIANLEGFYYKPRIDKEVLRAHTDGLIGLSACLSGEISRALLANNDTRAEALAREYADIFGAGNFFIEIGHHPNIERCDEIQEKLVTLAHKLAIPLVATQDIHYLHKDDARAQDILIAVQTNTHVDDPERLSMRQDDFSMRSPAEMHELFKDTPEAVDNTLKIADACNVELTFGKLQLPNFVLPKGKTAEEYLEQLCEERIGKKYPNPSPEVRERLAYELSVIRKTGFATYFLMVQDFVNWAKDNKIVVGPGRGSAAGSIVSYILNITNVDPIRYNLIFERFMNPDRISPPDIDLDFADTRRDEVIEYVSKKYGRDHVAQIITFGTMAARAAIRDAGRAMGLSYGFCDRIAKLIPFQSNLTEAFETVLELKELYETDPQTRELIDAAKKLEGVARHASTHACGVVITKEPLTNVMPLQYATSGTDTDKKSLVTQYEMHAVEDLGILKVDFLGLANLSIIEETIKRIKERHEVDIDIDKIPLDDTAVFKLFRDGETTGLFQFESAGMRRYLKELKPTELEDLIAMVALYRPGPMELIPSYIARKNGKEPITYIHPKLEDALKNTYGIGIYQEQMMRIARDLAGYTLAEADTLRKAIGKKIKSLLDEQSDKLIAGMTKNSITEATAKAIWELFPPFARYGFNRSHAAAYALVAYQTGYLKAHYPADFMASLLNAESKNIERIALLVSESKSLGINILPPSINESNHGFTVVSESEIRFGLATIKNVGHNTVEAIMLERDRGGSFESLEDILNRLSPGDINKKSMEALVKSGTMDEIVERAQVLKYIEEVLAYNRGAARIREQNQSSLFDGASDTTAGALRLPATEPATPKDRLQWEKELLGLYVSGHPLEHLRKKMPASNVSITDIKSFRSGVAVKTAGIISNVKKILTKKGDTMAFMRLEDFHDAIEAVVFPRALQKFESLLTEEKCISIRGKTNERNGVTSILCDEIKELA